MSSYYGNDPEVRTVVVQLRAGVIDHVVVPKGVEVKVVDWDDNREYWWDEDGWFDPKAELDKGD